MATLREIKRRIIGVQNTQQITKAMKMVAAARLKRAQDNIINARPYSRKLTQVLNHLLTAEKNIDNPLLDKRSLEKLAIVIVTSDRGLCGAFNMNIIREVEDLIETDYANLVDVENIQLYTIGKKGYDYFKHSKFKIAKSYTGIFGKLKFDFASSFMKEMVSKFLNGEVDRVIVVFNEFKSVIQQNLKVEQLLPIELNRNEEELKLHAEYIYEPDKSSIINSILPKYLNATIWKVLLESYAAELGARMTAMDMATENAKEMIRSLKIKFNKERQASITKEIIEIVSGANALKGT